MTTLPSPRALCVGETATSTGRTVEISDIVSFAGLTGDFYPLHVDEEFAGRTKFGTRIAHGPLVFSFAVGLVALDGFYGDSVVALTSVNNLRAHRPVKPGDTIRVLLEVGSATDHRSGENAFFDVDYDVRNQRDETVMTFTMTVLARKQPTLDVAPA